MRPVAADLKRQFSDTLHVAGIWVVVTRADSRFRCRDCYNLTTKDSANYCGTCFGTGFLVTLERWKVMSTQTLVRGRNLSAPMTPLGWSPDHEAFCITRAADAPDIGARVFNVEWDRDVERSPYGAQPTRIIDIFQVTYRDPQYMSGTLIYYVNHGELIGENSRVFTEPLLTTPIDVTRFPD